MSSGETRAIWVPVERLKEVRQREKDWDEIYSFSSDQFIKDLIFDFSAIGSDVLVTRSPFCPITWPIKLMNMLTIAAMHFLFFTWQHVAFNVLTKQSHCKVYTVDALELLTISHDLHQQIGAGAFIFCLHTSCSVDRWCLQVHLRYEDQAIDETKSSGTATKWTSCWALSCCFSGCKWASS